jgi:hypothetical protein
MLASRRLSHPTGARWPAYGRNSRMIPRIEFPPSRQRFGQRPNQHATGIGRVITVGVCTLSSGMLSAVPRCRVTGLSPSFTLRFPPAPPC